MVVPASGDRGQRELVLGGRVWTVSSITVQWKRDDGFLLGREEYRLVRLNRWKMSILQSQGSLDSNSTHLGGLKTSQCAYLP